MSDAHGETRVAAHWVVRDYDAEVDDGPCGELESIGVGQVEEGDADDAPELG